jgi:hypothetical protein
MLVARKGSNTDRSSLFTPGLIIGCGALEDVLDPVLFRAEGSTMLAEEDMKACDATAGQILQESECSRATLHND